MRKITMDIVDTVEDLKNHTNCGIGRKVIVAREGRIYTFTGEDQGWGLLVRISKNQL